MATTKRARFYVYRLDHEDGLPAYIGKGSTNRLKVQCRAFGLRGYEIARFFRERDAYLFERQSIAEYSPSLNKHPGGNGSRAQTRRVTKCKWEREMESIGTRAYSARFLIGYMGHLMPRDWNENMHKIAYG